LITIVGLVACNQASDVSKLPDDIGGNNNVVQPDGSTSSLTFTFPVQPSSIFHSIYVDEFDLETFVRYTVVNRDKKTGVVLSKVPLGGVKEEMLSAEDREKLKVAGHHLITATAKLDDGSTAVGSFKLHLKDRSGAISLAAYKFNLIDGDNTVRAFFGKTDAHNSKVEINVEKGAVIESWSEFMGLFPMRSEGRAISFLNAKTASGTTKLSASEGFPFTIGDDCEFTVGWTDDVVKISYDLNLPESATVTTGKTDPETIFGEGGKYANVFVARNTGCAPQPSHDEIDVYDGYYFAGWFDRKNDELYRFSVTVAEEDINLYAKWTAANYSFTIYTMGGAFNPDIRPSVDKSSGKTITLENAESLGYKVISSSSRFALSTGKLSRVTFTGFNYGLTYDKYVAEVTLNANGDKAVLKFSEFYGNEETDGHRQTVFVKGGDCLVMNGLFSDYQCKNPVEYKTHISTEQPVTYLRWKFNEPDKDDPNYDSLYLERISKYYTDVYYKDGLSVRADGSIRLETLADYDLNELIVPKEIYYKGEARPVAEFGDACCSNVKALTRIDLRGASNITTFGKRAFAYDDNLSEIVMPENDAISEIGDGAFLHTAFEENFYDINGGAEFIVINQMIYSYVGRDKTNIDLSNPAGYYTADNSPNMTAEQRNYFNMQLARVTSVEDSAFSRCPSLTHLTLSDGITTIKKNAFFGLDNFKNLTISSKSNLTDISENAFDGSGFLSEESNLYYPDSKAIIIGEIYYRMLDKSAESITVPSQVGGVTIKRIAPKAFSGCTALADIVFAGETDIISIGREALSDTAYIKNAVQGDAFTTVNSILTDYYSPIYDASDPTKLNLIVPDRVSSIASRAFGEYAKTFSTIQIGSNVKVIENSAFSGAKRLESVIFPDVTVGYNCLVHLPQIGMEAFADSKGDMLENLEIFFNETVIEFFEKLDAKTITTNDKTTNDWFSLYKLHKANFVAEDIKSVVIDRELISDTLLRTRSYTNEDNVFLDNYSSGIVEKALIITNNTGVQRRVDFNYKELGARLVKVSESGEYANLFESGKTKYVLLYKFNGEEKGCPVSADDPNLFVITSYNAIMGVPEFNGGGAKINANELDKDTGNFWLEGAESQVEDAEYPTFYTSNPGLNIRFAYRDVDGNIVNDFVPRVYDLNTKVVANAVKAQIRVDFYGLGTYELELTYSVTMSRFKAIEQTGPVIVPVNASSAVYMRQYSLDMLGEDGSRTKKEITRSNFSVVKVDGISTTVVNTSEMGMHTMTVHYSLGDALSVLEFDVLYTVVLDADESLFGYEILSNSAKTARIISCSSANASTIVIPNSCVIGGETYIIERIGAINGEHGGVFEGFKNLKAVYLPETLAFLGVNTFADCPLLERVYTSKQSDAQALEIPVDETHFNILDTKGYEEEKDGVIYTVLPVELISLDGVEYGRELVFSADYIANEAQHIKYRLVSIADGLKLKGEGGFDVYLPDTIYKFVNILDPSDNRIEPIFFASGSDFMFKTDACLPSGLKIIGSGAFRGCTSLKAIDFTGLTELTGINATAFMNSGLRSIDLSKAPLLTEINPQLFEGCSELESVILGENTTYIGKYAFSGCILLREISGFGANLKFIGESAFSLCQNLTRIDVYDVETMKANVFASCSALTIYVRLAKSDAEARSWHSTWNSSFCPVVWDCENNDKAEDGFVYTVVNGLRYALNVETGEATLAGQVITISGDIEIPKSITADVMVGGVLQNRTFTVTAIGADAFKDRTGITSVKVFSTLKEIGQYAFGNCTGLERFDFADENGLEKIETTAFSGCTSLAVEPTVKQTA